MTVKQLIGRYSPDGSSYSTITDGVGNLSTEPVLITGGLKQRVGNRAPDGSRYRILTDGDGTIFAGGGGGGGYVAKAVHFDGNTWLECLSLSATDNRYVSFSFWMNDTNIGNTLAALFVANPASQYAPEFNGSSNSDPADYNSTVSDGPNSIALITDASYAKSTWHSFIGAFDCQSGIGKLYIDDVDSGVSPVVTGSGFNQPINGLDFWFGTDNYPNDGFIGDAADFMFYPAVSLLTAGDIATATRRLFVDAMGKPVDPAVATAALGASCILFSGDHTTFSVNQGTGGAFTLTGALTNASTSPSD